MQPLGVNNNLATIALAIFCQSKVIAGLIGFYRISVVSMGFVHGMNLPS